MRKAWFALLGREFLLASRRPSDIGVSIFFFIMVASLFPLAISSDSSVLTKIGPGVLWVAVLLAGMLSLGRMFSVDLTDGCIEQILLVQQPLAVLVTAKILAHWIICSLPIVILAPFIGLQYALSKPTLLVLVISLLLGTPALSSIGAIGAALTLGVRGGSFLIALLVLPLYIPVLIFGASAVTASQHNMEVSAQLSLLAACSIFSIVLSPIATAAALRIAVE